MCVCGLLSETLLFINVVKLIGDTVYKGDFVVTVLVGNFIIGLSLPRLCLVARDITHTASNACIILATRQYRRYATHQPFKFIA